MAHRISDLGSLSALQVRRISLHPRPLVEPLQPEPYQGRLSHLGAAHLLQPDRDQRHHLVVHSPAARQRRQHRATQQPQLLRQRRSEQCAAEFHRIVRPLPWRRGLQAAGLGIQDYPGFQRQLSRYRSARHRQYQSCRRHHPPERAYRAAGAVSRIQARGPEPFLRLRIGPRGNSAVHQRFPRLHFLRQSILACSFSATTNPIATSSTSATSARSKRTPTADSTP